MVVGKLTKNEIAAVQSAMRAGMGRDSILAASRKDSRSCSPRTDGRPNVFEQDLIGDADWDDVLNACFLWGPPVVGVVFEDGTVVNITQPKTA